MLNLSALCSAKPERVVIRGSEVDVRALSASEISAMESQIPAPVVRGRTESEREVYSADPSFRERMRRYLRLQLALQCAACAGLSVGDKAWSTQLSKEEAESLADAVMASLTDAELVVIDRARKRVEEPTAEDIGTAETAGN